MAKGDKVIDLTEREINLIIFLSKKKSSHKDRRTSKRSVGL